MGSLSYVLCLTHNLPCRAVGRSSGSGFVGYGKTLNFDSESFIACVVLISDHFICSAQLNVLFPMVVKFRAMNAEENIHYLLKHRFK